MQKIKNIFKLKTNAIEEVCLMPNKLGLIEIVKRATI